MSRAEFTNWAVDEAGNVVASAAFEVRWRSNASLVTTVYDAASGVGTVSNPGTATSGGLVNFWLPYGEYEVTIGSGASAVTIPFDAAPATGVPRSFASRSAAVTEWAAMVARSEAPPVGTVWTFDGVSIEYDGVTTGMDGLPRWKPVAPVTPQHFGAVADGVTDDASAITDAVAYWNGTALNAQFADTNEVALYFPSGTYHTSGVTITTTGTGQVIYGDGQLATRLKSVELVIDDRHCSARGFSLTDSGTYGIRLSESSRRTFIGRNLHVRDRTYGLYMGAGAGDSFTDCKFEKNAYNLYGPDSASNDVQFTDCSFYSATINNIRGATSEWKFSNCVQGNAASVGMLITSRSGGATASVECYFSQMTNTIQQYSAFKSITAVADAGGGNITLTCANNFQAGETVEVFGTTDYNGTHTIVSATTTTFTVADTYTSSQTGVVRREHERVWRITGVTDAGGGDIEVTTDGDHDLVAKLTGLVISGTTDYDGTYDVVSVTGSNTFTVTATYTSSQTGTAALENWDVVLDGDGITGRVNDMYFNGGNTNYLKIKDSYNIVFNGTRLKEQIWLEGDNDRILFFRSRRGRNSDTASLTDIPVGGTTSNTGWSEVAISDTDNVIADDDTALTLAVPNFAAGVGSDNLPSLNEVRVAPDVVSHLIAGTNVFETGEGGIKLLNIDLGPAIIIASGAITPTHSFHFILGEGSAADSLTSIASGSFAGQVLILKNLSNSAPITVVDDNAARLQGDFILNDARAILGLIWDGSQWVEMFRRSNANSQQEKLPKTTVSGLSSLINVEEGDSIYVTDLRVFNGAGTQESAGNGTGGLATYNGTNWVVAGTNSTAVA